MRAGALLAVALLLFPGCKDEPPPKQAAPNPTLERGRIFRLEMTSVKVAKTVGSGATDKTLEELLGAHGLFLWAPLNEDQFCYVGFSGAAGSFASSSYARVRLAPDPNSVRFERFAVSLQLRDGRKLELDISGGELTPLRAQPEGGVIIGDMQLAAKGGFAITRGEQRLSGDVNGEWLGGRDDSPPDVQIMVPPDGLVTGQVRVFFDEPVRTTNLPERVFIRDVNRKPLEIDVIATKTDIPDATTEIIIAPRALLPFDTRLSVAISSEVADLLDRRLDKPVIAMFDTAHVPPLMTGIQHDFDAARGESELARIGTTDFVASFGTDVPLSGRFLRLMPPTSLATTASAVLTRISVPYDADYLEIRARKVSRTRDADSPKLSVGLMRTNGVIWSMDAAIADTPRIPFPGPDGEWHGTLWTDHEVRLDSQRGTEVILILEARPQTATMNPAMDTQFLIDRIRVVQKPAPAPPPG